MAFFRHSTNSRPLAPWEGPFAPPAPTGKAQFSSLVRTASELVTVAQTQEGTLTQPQQELTVIAAGAGQVATGEAVDIAISQRPSSTV